MAQDRLFQIVCVEGFDAEAVKVALIDDMHLLKEIPYSQGTPLEDSVARGKLQIIVKNNCGEILGSLSIDVKNLPEEGTYWLPLADSEEDFLDSVPEECRSPCLQITLKPIADSRAPVTPKKIEPKAKKPEGQSPKPEIDSEKALKGKVLSLDQALKAEKWKRQELADNFMQQLNAANFKSEKLQALLKKTSEKLTETEAKMITDKAKASEEIQTNTARIFALTDELEDTKAKLVKGQEDIVAKCQENADLAKTIADQTQKFNEETQLLQNEVLSLRSKVAQLQETPAEVPQSKETTEKLRLLSEELDLCKRMIRSQQTELERSLSRDRAYAAAEEGLPLKLKELQGKNEKLKLCVTELSEQNQLLTEELANVQGVLKEYTKTPRHTDTTDVVVEAEFKAFLKAKKLEHKVKAKADGGFMMQGVVVRPFKKAQVLLVNLECSLSYLEKAAHGARSMSVSARDIGRRETSTPLRDNRISHRRNMTTTTAPYTRASKADSELDRSFELKPQAGVSRDETMTRPSKENRGEQSSTLIKLAEDSSLQIHKVETASSLKKKVPFK